MTVTLIAAVGANRAIGRDNDMPWHLPEDLAHFKRTTLGHTLVMGRRTYDSIGRALPGRTTVVLTRQQSWSAPNVLVAHSLERAMELAHGDEVFIAGGGEIYAQALHLADAMVLTEVEQSPEAAVFFPEVDPRAWREVSRDPRDGFSFVSYARLPTTAG
jgi:dihydrofolate reductase